MQSSLFAKSITDGQEVTLLDHSNKICEAASRLFGVPGAPTRLSREWLRFFGLSEGSFEKFHMNLLVVAALHDLGKANDGFQNEIQGKKTGQAIRHEHLSGLLLNLPSIREWVTRNSLVDFHIVSSAVVSHHLKVKHEIFAVPISDINSFRVYIEAADFIGVLNLAARFVGEPLPAITKEFGKWSFDGQFGIAVEPLKGVFLLEHRQFNKALRTDESRRRFLLAVRAGLIAADSAGSAIIRVGQTLEAWIRRAFSEPLTSGDIEKRVIVPRIEEIKRKKGAFRFHDFQFKSGELGSRALLLSGCGSGKTLAAWKWIQNQMKCRPAGRVLFLYPTRATSTEGFRDYVSWAGPDDAALLHGTSKYDLEGMFANPGDPRIGGDYAVNERLFALGYWHKRLFSATVDSFLAFMQNKYGPLCLLPVLADSVIVVDEVHSFDDAMFLALVNFLRFFDVPVLCMTASLPQDRQDALVHHCGLEMFPKDESSYPDLRQQSEVPRYRVRIIEPQEAQSVALSALRNGQKVLWVVNTVKRCQNEAQSIGRTLPQDTVMCCYHSRFRLKDRRDWHEKVIRMFQENDGPAVVITTQVCEMSLDLDADVLITEAAPVTSLIQRMGRCCREPIPRSGRFGRVYACWPEDVLPYEKRDVESGYRFLEKMARKGNCSHADLAEYLARAEVVEPFMEEGYSSFLDSGWAACAKDQDFREGEEFTIECVLDTDLDAYLETRKVAQPDDGFIVPVPKRFARANKQLGRYLFEAPGTHYHPDYGFMSEVVNHES